MKTSAIRLSLFFVAFSLLATARDAHAQASGPYSYYALTPCRVVDTRNANGVNGGPSLGPSTRRDFQIRGFCGVPTTAKAVTMNVTVTNMTASSWLTIWPSGQPTPTVSTINFDPTMPAIANGAIVGLSTNTQDLSVLNANGNVNVIIDVTGYFQ